MTTMPWECMSDITCLRRSAFIPVVFNIVHIHSPLMMLAGPECASSTNLQARIAVSALLSTCKQQTSALCNGKPQLCKKTSCSSPAVLLRVGVLPGLCLVGPWVAFGHLGPANSRPAQEGHRSLCSFVDERSEREGAFLVNYFSK